MPLHPDLVAHARKPSRTPTKTDRHWGVACSYIRANTNKHTFPFSWKMFSPPLEEHTAKCALTHMFYSGELIKTQRGSGPQKKIALYRRTF